MDADRVRSRLDEEAQRFSVPGAQVGLLRGADRLVVPWGALQAGGTEPVRRTTPFHAGSITKSLVALAVVDAARRGEVDLDTPCSEQGAGLWSDTPRALMGSTTGRPNLLPEPD